MAAEPPPKAQNLHFHLLCFGASITAGWTASGEHFYPYSSQLSTRIANELQNTHFGIDLDGSPGDVLINGQYINRMTQDLQNAKSWPYDWVIIQAGGNDLGMGRQPEEIFEAMKQFWEIPLSTGANVLALTVTERGYDDARQAEKLQALNAMVVNHRAKGFYVADIARYIPFKNMPESERKAIWSDDIHFTQKGYALIGDLIADRLFELIQERPRLNIAPAVKL